MEAGGHAANALAREYLAVLQAAGLVSSRSAPMNATCRDFAASLGLLVLRLGMGGYMAAAHGWGKAQMVMAGK